MWCCTNSDRRTAVGWCSRASSSSCFWLRQHIGDKRVDDRAPSYCTARLQKQTVNVLFTITHHVELVLRLTMSLNEDSRFPRGSICRIWCRDTITIIRNLLASILTHTDERSRMHLDILTWYRLHFITSCLRCKMYLDHLSSTNFAQVRSSASRWLRNYCSCRCKLCCWWLVNELQVLQKVGRSAVVVWCK